jgi:predicted ferric reductase
LPIFVITIFHASGYWKWFILPAIFFVFEKILKLIFIKSESHGQSFIKDVNLLPSRVTHLVITRPKSFKFKAGDYVFVNIPDIAIHEWHPFTISSSPELKSIHHLIKYLLLII